MSGRIIEQAQLVLDVEAQAVLSLRNKIGETFVQAVDLLKNLKGKLVITGIGKSGQIARKLASTFSSTGTPSVYLHPSESAHGDLGLIGSDDVVLAISYGGEASELLHIINFSARRNIPLVAITGNMKSSLAKSAGIVLDVNVPKEACPLGLAPTASTTATLAMGDALAMTVLAEKGFSTEDFAEFHPGGSLGFRLLTRVKDIMHSGESMPLVKATTPVKEVFSIMTHKDVRGSAGVIDDKGELIGVITDGDIRRRLEKNLNPLDGVAQDLMNAHPRTIDCNELAEKALFMMEQFRIQMLFVLDKSAPVSKRPVGILIFQDLIKARVK